MICKQAQLSAGQRRIVAKVEQQMTLVDELGTRLAAAPGSSQRTRLDTAKAEYIKASRVPEFPTQ